MPVERYIKKFMSKDKKNERYDLSHCPFVLPVNQQSQFDSLNLDWIWWKVGRSEGQCEK